MTVGHSFLNDVMLFKVVLWLLVTVFFIDISNSWLWLQINMEIYLSLLYFVINLNISNIVHVYTIETCAVIWKDGPKILPWTSKSLTAMVISYTGIHALSNLDPFRWYRWWRILQKSNWKTGKSDSPQI
jgi:hypothetical protein